MPSVAELIAALPETTASAESQEAGPLGAMRDAWSLRPIPVGRFQRLRMLGTLQAKIGAAYLFYWLRGWFKDADVNKRAFAAASLGQVHRARLKTGQSVALKIQYPGIARTIREDLRNLMVFMLPARLSRDWESTKDQFEDLRMRLERETNYEQEAA